MRAGHDRARGELPGVEIISDGLRQSRREVCVEWFDAHDDRPGNKGNIKAIILIYCSSNV